MIFGDKFRRQCAEMTDSRVLSKIIESPTVLGLGDVCVIHPVEGFLGSGNTYLFLHDSEQKRCYEVLVKRRCNDTEDLHCVTKCSNQMRMRVPQFEHCAVLVVEEIGGEVINRALNLSNVIPLVVIKMQAVYPTGNALLSFTTLFDQNH